MTSWLPVDTPSRNVDFLSAAKNIVTGIEDSTKCPLY